MIDFAEKTVKEAVFAAFRAAWLVPYRGQAAASAEQEADQQYRQQRQPAQRGRERFMHGVEYNETAAIFLAAAVSAE